MQNQIKTEFEFQLKVTSNENIDEKHVKCTQILFTKNVTFLNRFQPFIQ